VNGGSICYVVVGIGMNLNVDVKVLSPDIRPRSTSVLYETGSAVDYHEFLRTFFKEFEEIYSVLCKQNFERIIKEWKNRTDTLGKTVRVQSAGETIQGVAVDIDPSGFLLLKTEKGEIRRIYSGDCLYR
jgi:BirA family biotin operon repressor/biotin-[acetyl-CoA-carboxylase] ligase